MLHSVPSFPLIKSGALKDHMVICWSWCFKSRTHTTVLKLNTASSWQYPFNLLCKKNGNMLVGSSDPTLSTELTIILWIFSRGRRGPSWLQPEPGSHHSREDGSVESWVPQGEPQSSSSMWNTTCQPHPSEGAGKKKRSCLEKENGRAREDIF